MGKRWIAVVLGLLLAAGALALWWAGVPTDKAAELASDAGEKVLREPLRPARGGPRVLVLALDGVGEEELMDAVRGGALPRVAALLGPETGDAGTFAHAYAAPGVLSVLPSTTLAAWSSLFTGEPPARTGVPGNEWFAREEARFYAPAPVTVEGHEDAVRVYTDDLIGQVLRAPTVFERADVRSYVSLAHVYRGADVLTVPGLAAFGDLATAMAQGVVSDETMGQEAYAELDETGIGSLLETIEARGPADLQVVYFPGVDLYTHVARAPLADQRDYLSTVVDPAIGRVLDAYRRAGALDSTYVLVVSDHGHTPVMEDDRHALEAEGADEPPEVLRRAGFRVRPFTLEPGEEDDFQAVVAYQGAFAYVYLADRSTCPRPGDVCDWSRPPRLEEDVLPVAHAFHEASRTGAGVPALRGALDLVFAREPRPVGQDALPFQVWDGAQLVPVAEMLGREPRPDLLALESRLEGLAAGPYGHRAGDVLLLARTGMGRPVEERFYFSGKYRSWHGSPSAQDSRIPLLLAHPAASGAELRETVRRIVGPEPSQLSITPLVVGLLAEP